MNIYYRKWLIVPTRHAMDKIAFGVPMDNIGIDKVLAVIEWSGTKGWHWWVAASAARTTPGPEGFCFTSSQAKEQAEQHIQKGE